MAKMSDVGEINFETVGNSLKGQEKTMRVFMNSSNRLIEKACWLSNVYFRPIPNGNEFDDDEAVGLLELSVHVFDRGATRCKCGAVEA